MSDNDNNKKAVTTKKKSLNPYLLQYLALAILVALLLVNIFYTATATQKLTQQINTLETHFTTAQTKTKQQFRKIQSVFDEAPTDAAARYLSPSTVKTFKQLQDVNQLIIQSSLIGQTKTSSAEHNEKEHDKHTEEDDNQSSWKPFSHLIVIHKQPPTPSLSATQAKQLTLSLGLLLLVEQAKVALLLDNQAIYEQATHEAMDWLKHYDIFDVSVSQKLLTQFKELSSAMSTTS